MRIVQVLTYVSPDNDFGGPVRVAVNQCTELRRRGHAVRLVAGAVGWPSLPAAYEGVPATLARVRPLLPGADVSGLAGPRVLPRLWPLLGRADVVHVHFVRDLVALPAAVTARLRGRPLVLQTHGMVDPSDRPLARPLDALATRRLLTRAGAVLHLTPAERADLERVARRPLPNARLMPNGMPPAPAVAARRDPRLVLFAARVHEQKRPEVFVRAAALVAAEVDGVHFAIAGPDGGRLDATLKLAAELGIADRLTSLGPLPHAELMGWFPRAAVYVLPSVYEPFGMTALEAMAVGTPVVVTPTCGLAPDVASSGAGAVAGPDPEGIAAAVVRLLRSPGRRAAAGAAGPRVAYGKFGIEAVVDELERVYREVRVARRARPSAAGGPS